MANIPVLIAGAGPTGLVLALWLARRQVPVRIIDKLPDALTTSRAVAVQARTLEFYRQLGLAQAVVEAGVKVQGLNFWVNGQKAARVPLHQVGRGLSRFSFVLTYSQDRHERLLIQTLKDLGVTIERSTELTGFTQNDQGVRAALKRPDGSEEICEASYLAGCDGASSVVRRDMGAGFPGGTYSQVFYVADVMAEGPPADGEIHIDLAQSDFVAVFPLKGETGAGHARLVGSLRPGAHPEPTFEDASDHALRQLQLQIKDVRWFSTYHVHHRVADRFRNGRAFILGDAAHIHSPAGGQGMNTGIGDAVNLAWKLAAVVQRSAPESLLDTYETERIPFAQRLVETTDRLFTLATDLRPGVQQVRTKILPLVAPPLFHLGPARRFLFRTASQIGIRYRESALSEGQAGAVHGGDRLPWVEPDHPEGNDNFSPLESLDWQVHVYGSPPPDLAETCARIGLPLHVFPYTSAMFDVRIRRNALYLIRPDGYIALATLHPDSRQLLHYFSARGLRPQETSDF